MHKKLLLLMLASASGSLWAMEEESLEDQLFSAVSKGGNYDEARNLISLGANVNANDGDLSVLMAATKAGAPIIRLLIESGADINARSLENERTALHFAARDGRTNEVRALLISIPLSEHQYIKNTFPLFARRVVTSPGFFSRDTQSLLKREIIAQLVQRHMNRVERLVAMRDGDDETAQQKALNNNHPEIAELLDPNNPGARESLRTQIERNIRRILFAPPEKK